MCTCVYDVHIQMIDITVQDMNEVMTQSSHHEKGTNQNRYKTTRAMSCHNSNYLSIGICLKYADRLEGTRSVRIQSSTEQAAHRQSVTLSGADVN